MPIRVCWIASIDGGITPGADQLVIAEERRVVGRVARVADADIVARAKGVGMVVAIATDVGKGGMVGVDAGVDHADDHALAKGSSHTAHARPDSVRVDPVRTRVGVKLEHFVRFDKAGVGQVAHDEGFLLG